VDQDTDQIVVSVVDEATGEVVRQIPAEEQLAIEAHLRALTGLLFSRTA
jgi:flagellar protein FlaG